MSSLISWNIADEKVGVHAMKSDAQSSNTENVDALKCLQVIDRQDLDFTEQLWNILRGVQSVLAFKLQTLQ